MSSHEPAPSTPMVSFPGNLAHPILTIDCPLALEAKSWIDVPAGARAKVRYGASGQGGGQVTYGKYIGHVMSGADWLLIRKDGVAEIDTRVTIAFKTTSTPDSYLLDGVFRGLLDLAQKQGNETAGREGDRALEDFLEGKKPVGSWQVVLSVRFEGAQPVPSGDSSWLPKRFEIAAKAYPEFKTLLRQQFIAVGTIEVRDEPRYPPTSISLSLFGEK